MDWYSRMVAWLKVLLPLMALGLLSTLFLLSRNIDPTASIPFAEKDVQDRLRDQQITGPFFSGATSSGDLISFSADKVGRGAGKTSAENVVAKLDLAGGTKVNITANQADLSMSEQTVTLTGDVKITTSTLYKVTTNRLTSSLGQLDIKSPDEVKGSGPIGQITAGSLQISAVKDGGPAQLIFTNAVKLIYDPQKKRE